MNNSSPKLNALHPAGDDVCVLWQEYGRKAVYHIPEAIKYQQDPQEAGTEARAVYKQPEGKEPKTPKYFGDNKSVIMQIEEQHRQSIPLRFFKYGQEICSAHEDEGTD